MPADPVAADAVPPAQRNAAQPRGMRRALNTRLFRWHRGHRRDLAVRSATDPWAILVAEVMSQQTGIERIEVPWRQLLARWPTPAALAAASTAELLRAWSGLGYNRRALALRAAAQQILDDHGGRVPRAVDDLARLPGLGPYTARAVAASAFGVAVAPLDVNVRRVVGRVTGAEDGLQVVADMLVSPGQPRRWLDAVMDLATLVCRPEPACSICPVATLCVSAGAASRPPVPRPSPRFRATRRWLRGRLVAAAVASHAEWVAIPDGLGLHDAAAVAAALNDLQAEGFIRVDGDRMRVAD